MLQLLLLLIRREGPLVVLRCGDRKLLADLVGGSDGGGGVAGVMVQPVRGHIGEVDKTQT